MKLSLVTNFLPVLSVVAVATSSACPSFTGSFVGNFKFSSRHNIVKTGNEWNTRGYQYSQADTSNDDVFSVQAQADGLGVWFRACSVNYWGQTTLGCMSHKSNPIVAEDRKTPSNLCHSLVWECKAPSDDPKACYNFAAGNNSNIIVSIYDPTNPRQALCPRFYTGDLHVTRTTDNGSKCYPPDAPTSGISSIWTAIRVK